MKKKPIINPRNPRIAALDIGTEKTCAMIAELETDGCFNVIGYGYRRSKGIINGAIANIKEAAQVIRETLNDAETMTHYTIESLIVNTPINTISSNLIQGSAPISPSDEISPSDVNDLIKMLISKKLSSEETMLHCIPYNYYTEHTMIIENPVGMTANKLGVRMSCISAPTNSLKIIDKVLSESRIEINKKVVCPFAAGLGCFDTDKNGIVIDIGAGKTSVAIFVDDIVAYTAILPYGGNSITTKIANDLIISHDEAERIKVRHGCALYTDDDGIITVKTASNQNDKISVSELNKIIASKVTDIFKQIKNHLEDMRMYEIESKRILLTGGGSQLQGICTVAADIFEGRQVALAHPSRLRGNISNLDPTSPIYSNIAGMMRFATIEKYQTPYLAEIGNPGLLKTIKSLFTKKQTF